MKEAKARGAITTVCPHCFKTVVLAVGASAGLATVEELQEEDESRRARPLDATEDGP